MPKRKHPTLDLSAAEQKAAASRPAKPLSDRQLAEYQSALSGMKRWLTRSRRAANALKKYQQKVSYYEKLMKKAGHS